GLGGPAAGRPGAIRDGRAPGRVEGRELAEVSEAEVLEALPGGAVKEGPSGRRLPPDDPDQPALEEMREDALRPYPAELLDLPPADRLPVGDDGQGLDGGPGQSVLQPEPFEA